MVRYFESFAGYDLPFRPVRELSAEDAVRRASYYVGTYAHNRLIRFEKFIAGQLEFQDEYEYWPDGKLIQSRRMTKSDGTIISQQFDQKGRIIR